MNADVLRQWQEQWQALLRLMNPAPAAPRGGDENAPAALLRRWQEQWQAFSGLASQPASPMSAQGFVDFLREQFGELGALWSAPAQPQWHLPSIGPWREQQQRWERLMQAAQDAEGLRHQLARMWADSLREAAEAFVRRAPSEPTPAGARKAYDAWIEAAEAAYARMAHGEAFCQAQAKLVNAASAQRRELQAYIESWAKLLDLPTRSELNTLHQRLRELQQQLRARAPKSAPKRPAAKRASPKGAPRGAKRR